MKLRRAIFGVSGVVCAMVVAVGCSLPGAAPTVSASAAGGPTGDVAVDNGSSLVVDPLGDDGKGGVTATFSQPSAGRTVYLQTQGAAGWETLAEAKEDASGVASFSAPTGTSTYRAVAAAGDSVEAVATDTVSKDDQYHTLLSDDFTGDQLNSQTWAPRQTDFYGPSRTCSAPTPSMYKVADGKVTLSVNASSAARTKVAKAAAIKLGADASDPCPYGAFDNAMIATETLVQFRYGLVAAKVKFSPDQGLHGGAWLQSTDGVDEIDFIESFGYGKGIQYKLHSRQDDGTIVSTGGYITSIPAVKTAEWWDEYHVAAVEWTKDEYVFSVDGQVVHRTKKGVSQTDKFLILSMLSSDWELPRLDKSKLPSSMAVDWVRVWQK